MSASDDRGGRAREEPITAVLTASDFEPKPVQAPTPGGQVKLDTTLNLRGSRAPQVPATPFAPSPHPQSQPQEQSSSTVPWQEQPLRDVPAPEPGLTETMSLGGSEAPTPSAEGREVQALLADFDTQLDIPAPSDKAPQQIYVAEPPNDSWAMPAPKPAAPKAAAARRKRANLRDALYKKLKW